MVFAFAEHLLDCDRRELRYRDALIALEPQVFDLLAYLVRHRDRVVGKDELVAEIWQGRIVSDSALTTRINAVRRAVGDNGNEQRLVRTHRRKGFRFVGKVGEISKSGPCGEAPPRFAIGASPSAAEECSIAILPFVAIDADPDERRFADGLVEDIVTMLGRFRWLAVHAPISARSLGVGELGPSRAGRRLGVRYVVQGAVRRAGRQVRTTIHLIDTTSAARLWSECFDGFLGDGFVLHDKFASMIAGRLEPALQSAEARRWAASPDRAATPYALRLRAQPIFSSGRESILTSLGLLEHAIERDPSYGAALADAANCLQILDVNGWIADRRSNRRKALGFARQALQTASDPEPVAIAAFVEAYFGEEVDAAAALLDHALTLNPGFGKGWYMHGMTRLYAGEAELAAQCFEKAIELNPRDHVGRRSIAGIGFARFFTCRFDEALSILRPVLGEFPRWATPYCVLASCHAHLGFLRESQSIVGRLAAVDTSPVPNAAQFRGASHRELLAPGLKLAEEAAISA